jgi:Ankyrin repeats (3 copies)
LSVQVLERLLGTSTALCACGMQPPPTADVKAFPDLLDSLVQPLDINGRTPLHHAAWAGSPESVRQLCKVLAVQGCSVDTPDDCDWTPLHLAAAGGNAACIDNLIEAGAKPEVLDIAGWAPVHYAAQVCDTLFQWNMPVVRACRHLTWLTMRQGCLSFCVYVTVKSITAF